MNIEFFILRFFTKHLPRIRGSGWIANKIKNVYTRKPRPPVTTLVDGFLINLIPGESVSSNECLFIPHLVDSKERKYLISQLSEGDVFIDVGAHFGLYTLTASRCVRQHGRIISIEADPYMCKKLDTNIRLNNKNNVESFCLGVSDKKEVLALEVHEKNRGGTRLTQNTKHGSRQNVECKPLVDILDDAQITSITGLKIDVEGYEYKTLRHFFTHAPKVLHPQFIITENNTHIYRNKLIELLEEQGYKVRQKTRRNYIMEKQVIKT